MKLLDLGTHRFRDIKSYAEARDLLHAGIVASRTSENQLEVGVALALLGIAERGLGDVNGAQQRLVEALRLGIDTHSWNALSSAVMLWALLLMDRGDVELAAEFYALRAENLPGQSQVWIEDAAGRYIRTATSALPQGILTAAQGRGWARNLLTTAQEILAEIEL